MGRLSLKNAFWASWANCLPTILGVGPGASLFCQRGWQHEASSRVKKHHREVSFGSVTGGPREPSGVPRHQFGFLLVPSVLAPSSPAARFLRCGILGFRKKAPKGSKSSSESSTNILVQSTRSSSNRKQQQQSNTINNSNRKKSQHQTETHNGKRSTVQTFWKVKRGKGVF